MPKARCNADRIFLCHWAWERKPTAPSASDARAVVTIRFDAIKHDRHTAAQVSPRPATAMPLFSHLFFFFKRFNCKDSFVFTIAFCTVFLIFCGHSIAPHVRSRRIDMTRLLVPDRDLSSRAWKYVLAAIVPAPLLLILAIDTSFDINRDRIETPQSG